MKKSDMAVSPPFWRDKRIVPIILQVVFTLIVVSLGYFFISNALAGLEQMGMKLGFDFLKNIASFSITESVINYQPTDSYGRAIWVGVLNTLRVSFFGIILASIIGVVIGVARLSSNWLVSKVAAVYTEVFRNTPLLVQIFIWFFAVFLPLPKIEEAVTIGSFYFSNRGTAIPWFDLHSKSFLWGIILIVGIIVAIITNKVLTKKAIESGKRTFPVIWSIVVLLLSCLTAFIITQTGPATYTAPVIDGKRFVGGFTISPGFSAVLIGLVIYTSTYIAEIVRAGIMGVPKGQIEAAKALGFKSSTSLRLIVFPQAIRTIIPPLTSQYLNLIKNSSLAVAVGYQDIVSIGNTVMNQTGRTLELIAIMVIVYLSFSLLTSLFMNYFNKKFRLIER